ncbi:hypothetical protein E3V39_11905 [Gammaproteobacteria bacterium LSUCC0112]|nr:hypothetical protein E3V39_11905 [Gammaproteobacteria bacterium LSUCC0112]
MTSESAASKLLCSVVHKITRHHTAGFKTHASQLARLMLISVSISTSGLVLADRPHGWISTGSPDGYTPDQWELEITGSMMRVNDTLDFMNIRRDILSDNTRLGGQTGDFKGFSGEVQFGILPSLSVFYRQQEHDLTAELSQPASLDLESVDSKLRTKRESYGVEWVFYEAATKDKSSPWRSASLELASLENSSEDFGASIQRISLNPTSVVEFRPPQRFTINRMADDGWTARVALTQALSTHITSNAWLSHSRTDASSGTSSEIPSRAIAAAFAQTFDLKEKQWSAGASLRWNITPRLPMTLSYEFIKITDRELIATRESAAVTLPSFLRADNLTTETTNHVLQGSIDWWITPRIFVGAGGKLMSNQFLGILPHYNNPLSGSLSDVAYGFAELRFGMKLSVF